MGCYSEGGPELVLVLLFQMFKGPNEDIEGIFTAPVSAVCGVTLDASGKKEYLISGVYYYFLFSTAIKMHHNVLSVPSQPPHHPAGLFLEH